MNSQTLSKPSHQQPVHPWRLQVGLLQLWYPADLDAQPHPTSRAGKYVFLSTTLRHETMQDPSLFQPSQNVSLVTAWASSTVGKSTSAAPPRLGHPFQLGQIIFCRFLFWLAIKSAQTNSECLFTLLVIKMKQCESYLWSPIVSYSFSFSYLQKKLYCAPSHFKYTITTDGCYCLLQLLLLHFQSICQQQERN